MSVTIASTSRRLRRAEMRALPSVKFCKRDSAVCLLAYNNDEMVVGHAGFGHPTRLVVRDYCAHCKRNIYTGAKVLGPSPATRKSIGAQSPFHTGSPSEHSVPVTTLAAMDKMPAPPIQYTRTRLPETKATEQRSHSRNGVRLLG